MDQPARLSRATVSRLAILAVDTLAAACDAGSNGPVERTALHRLALGYLMLTGVTAPPQAATMWRLIGHEGVFEQLSCRQSHSGVMLDGMRQRAAQIGRGG
jgi:hypothetical protein